MKKYLGFAFFWMLLVVGLCQQHFPGNAPTDKNLGFYAFTNATVVVSPKKTVEGATLVIREGKIVSLKPKGTIPDGAIEVDLGGQYVYPSFIDLHSSFGQREINIRTSFGSSRDGEQFVTNKKNVYWNEQIQPQQNAFESFRYNDSDAKKMQSAGFGYVLSQNPNGMARGTGMFVALQKEFPYKQILQKSASSHFSMNKAPSQINYPTALVGKLALFRQFFADVDWYKKSKNPSRDYSLEAYIQQENLPHFVEVENKRDIQRIAQIKSNFIVKAPTNSYEALNQFDKSVKLIYPLNFPKAFEVANPFEAKNIDLHELREWNQAPKGAAWIKEKGHAFALTHSDVANGKDWWKNLRKAVAYGLDKEAALESLTLTPAKWMGLTESLGSIEPGKWASFFVSTGDMFSDEKAQITQHWVQGIPHELGNFSTVPAGKYTLRIGDESFDMELMNETGNVSAKIDSAKVKWNLKNGWLNLTVDPKDERNYRLSGSQNEKGFSGYAWNQNNEKTTWTLVPNGSVAKKEEKENKPEKTNKVFPLTYPNMAYGFPEPPKSENMVIRNATLWTNEKEGIIEKGDIWIKDGQIKAVGKSVSAKGAKEVDGSGMHVTPGIIDEHSHIVLERGVNEWGQNNSAEVRMGDALNNEDINILRQLSGGVTTSQLLHGSANPMGGQSQIIKLKWGATPEGLKFPDAPKFIKFALGENVKQSNWNLARPTRYPQTRMGVEQLFYDAFYRAKAYNADKSPNKRIDYELEALAEILRGERNISCHSYVQSEIKMLMSVADSMKFKVNTFTHILEGYKVADEMAKHGAAGSTFSDWWAYKFEVNDAIPQNASLMHRAGVLSAINSDDAEMARRLNQEAGKSIKYGGMNEEDALKMVTLNPAKMLHIDHRVGSLKAGKDADIVLWNAHPLSQYAVAQKTFVDGQLLFDRASYAAQRAAIAKEKNELIQMMMDTDDGEEKRPVEQKENELYTCESLN